VSNGEIDYTVADENVAIINSIYFSNIDVKTNVSLSQQISWAVRSNAPVFLKKVNNWIEKNRRTLKYNYTYRKYYNPKEAILRSNTDLDAASGGNSISIYDQLIKEKSAIIGWDWRLLSSLIYQESRFDPDAKSWAGATGLMQILPRNVPAENRKRLEEPEINVTEGVEHLNWLTEYWKEQEIDSLERLKFILGSYNVGHGHVQDARDLAKKLGKDPNQWDDNVADMLLLKSKPKYYLDPVVKYGYCRGQEPVNYVRDILERYKQYVGLINT
jgi:membrane-bound lytic murein transglycosylase F